MCPSPLCVASLRIRTGARGPPERPNASEERVGLREVEVMVLVFEEILLMFEMFLAAGERASVATDMFKIGNPGLEDKDFDFQLSGFGFDR